MKTPRISRRQFFKVSAFGAGALALPALGLTAVVATPSREAQAAAEQPDGPAIPQPTFTPIASNTTFGALTDISMGWDGTLWGIDAQGAPHIYDAINDAWQPHGAGVDVAASDNQVLYLFSGSQYVTFDLTTRQTSAPADIAATWPTLPDTFKLGVNGASYDQVTKKLYLFDGGRYAPADGSAPPKKLTDLANWPANDPTFGAGVIHGVFSALTSDGTTITFLLRGSQTLRVDLATEAVTDVPQPFTNYYDYATFLPADFRINGLDAGVAVVSPEPYAFTNYMYRGAGIVTWQRGSPYPQVAQYIASAHSNWPATWHPVLLQAPSGRDGNLWSVVTTAGYAAGTGQVIQHNGEAWTVPAAGTIATSVSAGQDGTIIQVQPNTNSMWRWSGSAWVALGAAPAQLQQVSLGGTNDVWVRDVNNNVYRFDPPSNTFTQSTTVGQATHIATTGDGTLWHARPSDTNAYRLLAGQNVLQPAILVQQGIVTGVQKVTGTGFGASYCLAQAGTSVNLYRYDSPYVFKSQYGFSPIAGSALVETLGAVYFTNSLDFNGDNYPVIALDAHTGVVRSQSASVPNPMTSTGYTPPVFDPVNELIYVGITQPYDPSVNNIGPGQIIALDAHDLSKVVWSYNTSGFVNNALTVIGTALIVGDLTGNVYLFDTVATLANPAQPAPAAIWSLPVSLGLNAGTDAWSLSEVISVDDSYVMTVWDLNVATAYLATFQATTLVPGGVKLVTLYDDGLSQGLETTFLSQLPLAAPVVQQRTSDGAAILAINAIAQVMQVNATDGSVVKTFAVWNDQDAIYVLGGLTLDTDNNQLWFGSSFNTLYCLDTQFRAVNHTPISVTSSGASAPVSTPVLYRDTSGGKTIFTGVLESANVGYLYGFDPDNGNLVSLPTGDTQILALSRSVANGVIYAGGVATTGTTRLSQLFGLRVDDLIQAERDFIIESQLMQDPDQTATNGSTNSDDPIPPSVARYQTHISVVDDQKTPRINEPIKIWADVPGTVITIEGAQYTIGPGDAQYAQTQTGPDGTVVVMTDATDVNASALRAWASFMDPYERIVIYPDHEWHGRVTASYDDPNANVTQPDPTRPNLSTVHTYSNDPATNAPKQLFTDDEKTDKYPGTMANAISQMQAGLNPAGNSAATLAGSLKTRHASDPVASYIAYGDLGGMHYAPNNALAERAATTVAPFGLMWDTDDNDNATFTILSHSDAADEIDAITGTPWNPNDPNFAATQADGAFGPSGVLRVHSWGSFWHHVRDAVEKAGAKIKKVVVSAADKIKAAIAYVANGVTTFFKTVIEVVEDVVESIGAFFLQLGKLIEDVIEALSLLFHFGEIMKTHRWMRSQFTTILQSTADGMQNQAKPALDDWFNKGEQAIVNLFQTVRQSLGIDDNTQINDLSNAQTSAHTAFKAGNGSAGPSSGGDSHAVQCTHSTHKLKSGLPSATISLPSAAMRSGANVSPTAAQGDVDVLLTFMSDFIDSLENNAALKEAFGSLTNAINSLVQPHSAGDFFKSALNTLLSIIESLIVSVVAVTQALVDGLMGVMASLINLLLSLLTTPIDIPFFSWLYKFLFGEDLTILNLVTLVAAIPVTVIYRIASGNYPSQDGFTSDGFTSAVRTRSAQQTSGSTDNALVKIQGTIGAVLAYGLGVSRLVVDALGKLRFVPGSVCVLVFGALYVSTYGPYWDLSKISSPTQVTWANWGLGLILASLGTFGVWQPTNPATQVAFRRIATVLRAVLAVARWALFLTTFVKGNNFQAKADLAFARNMILEVPPFFNWLKLPQRPILDAVLVVIDGYTAEITVALDLTVAWLPGDAGPLSRRQFLPWVTYHAQSAPAQPQSLALVGSTQLSDGNR